MEPSNPKPEQQGPIKNLRATTRTRIDFEGELPSISICNNKITINSPLGTTVYDCGPNSISIETGSSYIDIFSTNSVRQVTNAFTRMSTSSTGADDDATGRGAALVTRERCIRRAIEEVQLQREAVQRVRERVLADAQQQRDKALEVVQQCREEAQRQRELAQMERERVQAYVQRQRERVLEEARQRREEARREREGAQRQREAAHRQQEAAQRQREAAQRQREEADRERDAAHRKLEEVQRQRESAEWERERVDRESRQQQEAAPEQNQAASSPQHQEPTPAPNQTQEEPQDPPSPTSTTTLTFIPTLTPSIQEEEEEDKDPQDPPSPTSTTTLTPILTPASTPAPSVQDDDDDEEEEEADHSPAPLTQWEAIQRAWAFDRPCTIVCGEPFGSVVVDGQSVVLDAHGLYAVVNGQRVVPDAHGLYSVDHEGGRGWVPSPPRVLRGWDEMWRE